MFSWHPHHIAPVVESANWFTLVHAKLFKVPDWPSRDWKADSLISQSPLQLRSHVEPSSSQADILPEMQKIEADINVEAAPHYFH